MKGESVGRTFQGDKAKSEPVITKGLTSKQKGHPDVARSHDSGSSCLGDWVTTDNGTSLGVDWKDGTLLGGKTSFWK